MATSADYGLGEFPFPRGWFAVTQSDEVVRRPLNVRYFGQDLVLYRGASGAVVMLDAYCPHMGTHLGRSDHSATVESDTFLEGDSIRCPFHAWRFGADGRCDDIPYFDGPIPEKARVRSWPVEERYGIVFCWHDPENRQPDFGLPEIPEWDDPAWVRWQGLDHVDDLNHPVEIVDNNSDVAHLDHLHGGEVVAYENEVDGVYLHQRQSLATDNPAYASLSTLTSYVGPGLAVGRFLEAQAVQLICHTPIEDGTCRLWSTAILRARSGTVNDEAREQRDQFAAMMVSGLRRDGEVWKHKRPALTIMQLPTDGPFGQSRKWYSQFYNPRDKAAQIVRNVAGKHAVRDMPDWSSRGSEGQAQGVPGEHKQAEI